jgi:putative spermidine/putrescine transport system ATP-binding protein
MTSEQDSLVRFVDVEKSYDGETLVVKRLGLAIRRGEFLTLLGPSGSGKTTCLMMLAGFETPTHGDIVLDGRSLARVPPHRRDIGMVFQNYALFPHMTVAENLAFPLEVRRIEAAERARRIGRALEMVRLEGLGARRPAQLSGGQQQRVALARALVFQPKLVLMDEPLGALDKQLRESMQYEIKHIHASLGVTIVYVTHDQSEALTMSDRIAVFHDGVIQQIDSPADLYERPRNSFVAGFIGENNRLQGRVEEIRDGRCRVRLDAGGELMAVPAAVDRVGARTTVSIRPERVTLGGAAGPDLNRLPARVLETTYHGDHLRLRLAVAGNDEFTVKLPLRGFAGRAAPSGSIELACRPEDCRALDPVPPLD